MLHSIYLHLFFAAHSYKVANGHHLIKTIMTLSVVLVAQSKSAYAEHNMGRRQFYLPKLAQYTAACAIYTSPMSPHCQNHLLSSIILPPDLGGTGTKYINLHKPNTIWEDKNFTSQNRSSIRPRVRSIRP